jgi:hypothetical protein
MTTRQIRLDELKGRVVRDAAGRSLGRLFEVRGEERDGELLIVEYSIAPVGWFARAGFLLRVFAGRDITSVFAGRDITSRTRTVPWDQLDVSDPAHPVWRQ